MKLRELCITEWAQEIKNKKVSIFFSPWWISLTEKIFRKEVKYFVFEQNNNFYLLLPYFDFQNKTKYSIGFIGYEGLISNRDNNINFIEKDVKVLFLELKDKFGAFPERVLLGLNEHPKLYNLAGFNDKVNYAQILDISKELNYIFEKTLSGNVRTAIRKAIKDNIYVTQYSCSDTVIKSYKLLENTQKLVGATYITPYEFFQALSTSPYSQLFVAKHGTEIVAMSVCLFSSHEAFFYLNGWNRHYASSSPNQLLVWEMIKVAKERKIENFNFGISHSESLMSSKLKWGANNFSINILERIK